MHTIAQGTTNKRLAPRCEHAPITRSYTCLLPGDHLAVVDTIPFDLTHYTADRALSAHDSAVRNEILRLSWPGYNCSAGVARESRKRQDKGNV
jgi:hypothetical protein